MTPQGGPSSTVSGRDDCGMGQDAQNGSGGYSPIGVWWAGGVEYTDYRLRNGCIVSVESLAVSLPIETPTEEKQ